MVRFAAKLAAALASAFAAVTVAHAAPVPILGNVTVVNPTIAPTLQTLNIAPSLLGSATANSNGFFQFPITGGQLDGLAGTILHEASGIQLVEGGDTVRLENFIIDTVQQVILADVSLNAASVATDAAILRFDVATLPNTAALFDLNNPLLALFITDVAADLLENAFGLTVQLNGVQFGLAATDPRAVPLPAAAWLFIAGVAGLLARRRQAAASA